MKRSNHVVIFRQKTGFLHSDNRLITFFPNFLWCKQNVFQYVINGIWNFKYPRDGKCKHTTNNHFKYLDSFINRRIFDSSKNVLTSKKTRCILRIMVTKSKYSCTVGTYLYILDQMFLLNTRKFNIIVDKKRSTSNSH